MNDNWTRRLTYLGLLTALAVIFTRFLSFTVAIGGVDNFRLGIGHLFLIMAGILYGPLAGAYVGGMADIIGYVVRPGGPYNPLFTLTSVLTAALPGLVLALSRRKKQGLPSLWELLAAVATGQTLSSMLLVSYFLQVAFGMPFWVSMAPRVTTQAFLIPAYAALLHVLLRRLSAVDSLWQRSALAKAATGGSAGG